MSWTDERVTLLEKLWGEGHTAAEIAKQLGGITRNAVIGKAHRMKLSGRVSPIQQNKKSANSNVDRKPKKTVKAKPRISILPKADKVEALPKQNVEVKKKSKEKLFDLMDLQPRMCRWPSGDPQEDDFGFCGERTISGIPYCAEHAKMAYQAATRNRIFTEAEKAKANSDGVDKKKVATSS